MNAMMFLLVLLIVVTGLVGCTLLVGKWVQEKPVQTEQIQQQLILTSFNGKKCPQKSLTLWQDPRLQGAYSRTANACGGVHATATLQAVVDDTKRYFVRVGNTSGWVNESSIGSGCTNASCQAIKRYDVPALCWEGICVECLTTRDCKGNQVCDEQEKICVDCLTDTDCSEGVCASNTCVDCRADEDCLQGVCHKESCVACVDNYDCPIDEYCASNRCIPRT